ncbi:hypothetical protein [Longispora albida]|uniref:hypothetical protein n=1 Tax=Longispora albida TaxID=203523 RepID=UPI000362FAB3|nr:hypothetical protein [Longispora albida]
MTRRFYRLRTPAEPGTGPVAVSVRVDETTGELYLAVGAGRRRMGLTPDEAWALWRCLSEAVSSVSEPPAFVMTHIKASRPRKQKGGTS